MQETSDSCSKYVQEEEEELPLHEYVVTSPLVKNHAWHKALLLLRAALYLLFIAYRLRYSCNDELGLAALTCEVCFCINFLLSLSYKWFIVERAAHPDRLLSRYRELPRVDVFVTTADPIKEPTLITINTVLSALALHYPTHKLACYVSDDGGSLLTLWALKEAASFAKSWIPFCKMFSPYVYPRAPGPYFARKSSVEKAKVHGFYRELHAIKEEYYALESRISSMNAAYCNSKKETIPLLLQKLLSSTSFDSSKATYSSWAMNYDPCNHSSYCEILLDKLLCNTNMELPYLVYMSREKRPKQKHHFKAGAMNALLRVSGIMTNAPYVLNLDCDMYVNEAKALLQAMCFFMQKMEFQVDKNIGFVQFPQCFEGFEDGDDIYVHMVAALQIFIKGMDGVQGPTYLGTGCIHKRETLYGKTHHPYSSQLLKHGPKLEEMFGHCQIFLSNAQSILSSQEKHYVPFLTEAALMMESIELMNCTYEDKTSWGKEVGLIYGSITEDLMTSMSIHNRGWKSIAYDPLPPAFIGCVPSTSEDALLMRERWSTGFLEILFSSYSPFLSNGTKGMSLIQRFIYIHIYTSILACLALYIYALLPGLSILTKRQIYPKMLDPDVVIPLSLLICIYISNIYENKVVGVRMRQWWNSEKMESIVSLSSNLFAIYEVIKKKVMGLDTTFVVTPKEQKLHIHDANRNDVEKKGQKQQGFVVNSMLPIFIPPTILVLLNIIAIVVASIQTLKHFLMVDPSLSWLSPTEVACSMWVLFVLQPFSKGFLLWGLGQRGPFVLSSSSILHASLIVMALLSLAFYLY